MKTVVHRVEDAARFKSGREQCRLETPSVEQPLTGPSNGPGGGVHVLQCPGRGHRNLLRGFRTMSQW